MEKTFTQCDICHKGINCDDNYVSFVRNVEQTEFIVEENCLITEVIDSKQIVTLCNDCGDPSSKDQFSADTMSIIINLLKTDNSIQEPLIKTLKK